MSAGYPKPVVLDTTVVSNFASTDSVSVLAEVLASPVVVPTVRDELERGLDEGHEYLETAVDALGTELSVRSPPSDTDTAEIRDRLDPGEAESLLAALGSGGTLATDDLAAREIAQQRTVPVTGSIGLLVLCVESEQIDRVTADEWLDTWRTQRGYYAPIERIGEVIDEG